MIVKTVLFQYNRYPALYLLDSLFGNTFHITVVSELLTSHGNDDGVSGFLW